MQPRHQVSKQEERERQLCSRMGGAGCLAAPPPASSAISAGRPRHAYASHGCCHAPARFAEASHRCVASSIAVSAHAALCAHRNTAQHTRRTRANFQVWHVVPNERGGFVHRFAIVGGLNSVLSRAHRVDCCLEELLIEFVIGASVSEHELQILFDLGGA